MNPFKNLWWSLMASIKGMTYLEYIESERQRLITELAELPDTDNFLSVLLEYYSFKSVKRSCEVLVFLFGLSLIIFICSNYLEFSFITAVAGLWIAQILMFIVGFYLKHKSKS
jgi:hypothetical protein